MEFRILKPEEIETFYADVDKLRAAWRQYKDKSYKFPSYHFMGA